MGFGLVLLAIVVYSSSGTVRFYNHFVWQAMAFLDGRVAIDFPVPSSPTSPGNAWMQDILPLRDANGELTGLGLIPFPPLPAIVLLPFVAVFGLATDQRLIAVVLGGVALVVPGLLLLVLLALTGASERLGEPPPAALVDSVAVARANLPRVAWVVSAILVANLAVAFVLQWQLVPHITKKLSVAKLAPVQTFVRLVPLALAALSPLAACALAAAYARATRRTS